MLKYTIATCLPILALHTRYSPRSECAKHDKRIEPRLPLSSSARSTLIVKYGGSAVTVKGELETLNDLSLKAAAAQLCKVHKEGVWNDIVVVHGAGRERRYHILLL